MANWVTNAAIWWYDGSNFQKVSDHGRGPISVSVERIESKQRMASGTLRRYVVAKKRTWSLDWENLPSRRNPTRAGVEGMGPADGGWAGEDIENFHNTTDGAFKMRIRGGDDDGKAINDASIEEVTVMITDFSKDVNKRGVVDFWNLSITLEEV